MKRAVLLTFLAACGTHGDTAAPSGARAPVPGASSAARLVDGRFHSDALGADKAYRVWLPAGYDGSQKRYPVIYLLNPLGGNERSWTEPKGDLDGVAAAIDLQAIVVMPDGDASFYANAVAAEPREQCREEA